MQVSSATFIQNSAQGIEEGSYFAKVFEKSSSFSYIFASNSREM
jgi:hypothetical protein